MKFSVLTLTYQRYQILEEAMMSYLYQDYTDESEMVIVNDSSQVQYTFDDGTCESIFRGAGSGWTKKFRIINHPTRFSTIGEKLEFGYSQCQGTHTVRIDDDDLMMPYLLSNIQQMIQNNPGYDVYRPSQFFWFGDNIYCGKRDGINTGNVLSKEYLKKLTFPKKNADEDCDIVFSPGVNMLTEGIPWMIYRWGGGLTHISTQLHLPNEERLNFVPEPETGTIELHPHFDRDYYGQIHD